MRQTDRRTEAKISVGEELANIIINIKTKN